jgi:2-hydroxy-3-oxopropionate reductase
MQKPNIAKTKIAKPKVGFIGLGLMGSAMVSRLQDQEYPMTVIANRTRTRIDAAVARGASEATSYRDLAVASDIIMICVDTSASVEACMRGETGVIAGIRPGTIILDFGTSLPASTRALGGEVVAAGGAMLDAPLGRTPAHAREGKLNIMAAGDRDVWERAEPVLEELGENVFHLGELGAGHTVKLLNNFLGMTTANVVAEIYAAADLAGVDRHAVYNVISAGPLHSMMMDFVSDYALKGNPDTLEFSIRNGAKDMGYYARMLADAGTSSAIADCPIAAMTAAVDAGHGDAMVPLMLDHYRDRFASHN